MIPLVFHWNDTASVHTNFLPCRLSHIKMNTGWVAPTTIAARQCIVWWAQVGSSDSNRLTLYAVLAP
jgi:hypothetical protein